MKKSKRKERELKRKSDTPGYECFCPKCGARVYIYNDGKYHAYCRWCDIEYDLED